MTDRPPSPSVPQDELELYRALFNLAPIGIGVAASDGTLVVYNNAMMAPGGYTREDLAALRNVAALYYDPDERTAILAELAAAGRVDRRPVQFRRKDGTPYDTLLSLVPMQLGGRPHALAIVEDVTEQRKLEAQLRQAQKMEEIGQLTGGIAHDLNNLLTVVLATTELMGRSLPKARRDLQMELADIRAAATSGRDLLRRLLGFSRRQVLRLEPTDLAETVRGLTFLLRRVLSETISVRFTAGGSVPMVMADPGAVEQIVMNLITNARDAMPDGGTITIEVCESETSPESLATRPGLKPGRYVWLTVVDTGVGMDEETRERVFEPFFSTKAAGQGTGLGMAMVYGLTKEHDGYVHVSSRESVGTRVEIGFPVPEAVEPAPELPATAVREVRAPDTVTILLVEDESGVRRVATRALSSRGYQVLTAEDGDAALTILRARQDIDLLLVDLVMPRLGGRELVDHLEGEMRHIPVIFTSGYARDATEHEGAERHGIFLTKPWTLDELYAAIDRALEIGPDRLAESGR